MLRFRALGASVLALSLVVGVSGAALGTDMVFGHGIPKVKVDVCVRVGGDLRELKSNFKYGQTFRLTDLPAATYRISVRAASTGKCKGQVLIKSGPIAFDGSEDLSVIATKTKGIPSVVVFDNSEGYDGGSDPILSIKHAAMLGKADVYVDILLNEKFAADAAPTAVGVPKGTNVNGEFFVSDIKVGVAKTGTSKILKETPYWGMEPGKINHVVAIGPPGEFRFLRYRTQNKGLED